MEGWYYYGFTHEYMFVMGMLLARGSRKVGDLHTTRWCICAYIASFLLVDTGYSMDMLLLYGLV